MEYSECPSVLRKKASMRKATIHGLRNLVDAVNETTQGKPLEALFLADGCIITATISEPLESIDPVLEGELNIASVVGTRDLVLRELEKTRGDIELLDSGAFVFLRDATVRPLSNLQAGCTFAQLLLFVDQITAMSIGSVGNLEARLRGLQSQAD